MFKKRVVLYFVIMAFPMGLGAGAANWLQLPRIPLPRFSIGNAPHNEVTPEPLNATPFTESPSWIAHLPDFSAMHPLVVGSFSLLLCSGILLAADGATRRD